MAIFTEEEKIVRKVEQRFNKGVVKYRLIEDGDKILIGLSGGKDSLALLELLGKRSRILKPRFSVMAVHIGMTNIPYKSDLNYLKEYISFLEDRQRRHIRLVLNKSFHGLPSPVHFRIRR